MNTRFGTYSNRFLLTAHITKDTRGRPAGLIPCAVTFSDLLHLKNKLHKAQSKIS